MLRLISLVAAAAPQPHPTYVALGGSNTAGHNLTRDETRYSKLVYEALQQQQLVDTFQDSALGAMGPIVASSCSSRFVSREARFATVEYLPNLGHGDSGELEAVARLLDELKDEHNKKQHRVDQPTPAEPVESVESVGPTQIQ